MRVFSLSRRCDMCFHLDGREREWSPINSWRINEVSTHTCDTHAQTNTSGSRHSHIHLASHNAEYVKHTDATTLPGSALHHLPPQLIIWRSVFTWSQSTSKDFFFFTTIKLKSTQIYLNEHPQEKHHFQIMAVKASGPPPLHWIHKLIKLAWK